MNSSLSLNSTSITSEEWEERVQTATLYSLFGSLGIILNIFPILLTFCTDLRNNNVHVLVANLLTGDLITSLEFVFGQVHYILWREQLPAWPCDLLALITNTAAFFEYVCLTMLSINRFISLYHNEYYDKIYTNRNIALIVLGSWVSAGISPMIFMLAGKTGFDDDNQHCCILVKHSHVGWTIFYWATIVVPLVTMCDGAVIFCNYKVYKKLFSHGSIETLKNNVIQQNKEILYYLFADMSFPVVFHTTYQLSKFILVDRVSLVHKRIFTVLYLINACLRGLATLTMLRPYRLAVRKLFTCGCKQNTISPSGTGQSSGRVNA